jgi:NAD(P)-dependent dehydrogenase (short-subunit alcohol dehydrogenase family)
MEPSPRTCRKPQPPIPRRDSDESINAAVAKISSDFGVLDLSVNNAGIVVMQSKDRRAKLLETFNTSTASALS